MSKSLKLIAQLDQWFPPRGPCGLCEGPDARHRIWDAIVDGPDSDEEMAQNFDLSVDAVQAVRSIRPYRRAAAKVTPAQAPDGQR